MSAAGLFDALDDESRASVERHLSSLSRDELADEVRQAAQVLEVFCVAAETMSFFSYMVLTDCQARVREAADRAGATAGRSGCPRRS